jgi:endonuclease G
MYGLIVCIVEEVEKAAGLTIFPDAIKQASKHICASTKCEVLIKRFDDAKKNATKPYIGKRQ